MKTLIRFVPALLLSMAILAAAFMFRDGCRQVAMSIKASVTSAAPVVSQLPVADFPSYILVDVTGALAVDVGGNIDVTGAIDTFVFD